MLKIMVVDDLATDRLLICKILRSAGFVDIIEVDNGEDAVKQAAEHKPDIVFMDVVMPGMSGFQATRLITKANKGMPVVIVSTKDREPDKINSEMSGAKAHICKPTTPEILLSAVSRYTGTQVGS